MNEQNKKVPTIRFKGFTDDWEQRKVSDIFTVTRGQVLATTKISEVKTNEMCFPVYSSQTKNNGLMGYYNKYLFNTAITWTTDGANAGTVNYREGKFYSTNVNGVLLSDDGYANKAIAEILDRVAWRHVSRVGNPKLMNNVMSNIKISIPSSFEEQNAISEFLTKFDHLIALHQRKLVLLKQLKKGLLQKMFADKDSKRPILRFNGFTNDWEQRKLGEISERILRKNSDLQSLLPLTISAQDGLVDQTTYFNKQVASKQLKNYLLLYNGDFAYNKSYSVGYPYGAIKRLDKYKQGVLSTLYIAFKPTNINSDFLQHYYDTDKWYREIYRNAAEGARNHGLLNISANDFFNSKLITPSDNDEQLKIAKIINVFNRLITLQQRKITKYNEIKKSLLQQMFI